MKIAPECCFHLLFCCSSQIFFLSLLVGSISSFENEALLFKKWKQWGLQEPGPSEKGREGLRSSDLLQKPGTAGQTALEREAQPSLLVSSEPTLFKASGRVQDGLRTKGKEWELAVMQSDTYQVHP